MQVPMTISEVEVALKNKFANISLEMIKFKDAKEAIHTEGFSATSATPRGTMYRSRLSSYLEIKKIYQRIEKELGRFKYGELPNHEWDRRYLFPSESTSMIFKKKISGERLIANENAELSIKWLNNFVIADLLSPGPEGVAPLMLIGDVGCGKSTFLKYLTNRHKEIFIENKIIPSRIECQKTLDYLEKYCDFQNNLVSLKRFIDDLNSYILKCMFRDIAHFSRTKTSPNWNFDSNDANFIPIDSALEPYPCLNDKKFEVFCGNLDRNVLSKFGGINGLVRDVRDFFSSYLEKEFSEKSDALKEMNSEFESLAIRVIVGFFSKSGVKFCLFFDGFDYMQAADFVFSNPKVKIINLLTEWAQNRGNCGKVGLGKISPGHVFPKYLISIRQSTYGHAIIKFSQAFGRRDPEVSYLCPPNFVEFFDHTFKNIKLYSFGGLRDHNIDKRFFWLVAGIHSIMRRDLKQLSRDLGETEAQVNEIGLQVFFNGNIRHQSNYIRDIILELTADSLAEFPLARDISSQSASEDYIRILAFGWNNFLKQKKYRFIETLLYTLNRRFRNFLLIEDLSSFARAALSKEPPPLNELILDNNISSGYVGNLFSYHIPLNHGPELAYMLEKIRILEILRVSIPETEDGIRHEFEQRGWPCSELFRVSLYILIREAFIHVKET